MDHHFRRTQNLEKLTPLRIREKEMNRTLEENRRG